MPSTRVRINSHELSLVSHCCANLVDILLPVLAVDFVQEKFMGQGDQSNESAAEQAKDEAITDFIRDQYKGTTGSDFPIADKDKKYGA